MRQTALRLQLLPALLILTTFSLRAADPIRVSSVHDALKSSEFKQTETFSTYGPAVVGIVCEGPNARAPGGEGSYSGTGAVITADGLILTTTTTVPKGAHTIKVYFVDGHIRSAELKETDESTESSLIKVDLKNATFMKVANSSDYRVGDTVYTWGNPFNSIQKDGGISFSTGHISGLYKANSADDQSRYNGPVIETDAAVNPGSDGGPLTDADGNLIGVLSLAFSRTRWLGLAIPTSEIGKKMEQFKPLITSRRAAVVGENGKNNALQAAFEAAAGRAGKGVLCIRVVRENDKEEAPEDLSSYIATAFTTTEANRADCEVCRPANAFASAFLVSADGLALTSYFNVDDKQGRTESNDKHIHSPQQLKKMAEAKKNDPGMNPVKKIYAYTHDGKRYEAKLLAAHKSNDLAAIQLDLPTGVKLHNLEFDTSAPIFTGSSVAILGRSEAPGGLTLNAGRISALRRYRDTCSQINALLNYGNLGGPVIGLDGKVLGMAAHLSTETEWRQNCGVGFMLQASQIKKVLADLSAGKNIEAKKAGFLGVEGDMDNDTEGARVLNAKPASPAANGGVKSGDLIIEYNGKKISSWYDLVSTTRALNGGDMAKLKVKRGTQTFDLSVKLGERD